MTILRPTESFKMINRSGPTRHDRNTFDGLFLKTYKRYEREILTKP